jgi:hypothetical protein
MVVAAVMWRRTFQWPLSSATARSPGAPRVRQAAEQAKKLLTSEITEKPVTQVIVVGTKETRQCDPNYSGAHVPIASDVDCAGGSGNGPAYVQGPVRVVGTDIYDLDRNGDGVGCDG